MFSKYSEKIGSGRPGQSNSPFGVGKHIYQVQTGIIFSEVDLDTFTQKLNSEKIKNNTILKSESPLLNAAAERYFMDLYHSSN